MDYSVGQSFKTKRTLTQSDFQRFADLSGDDNPIHVDPEFSARSKFGRTVAHGMFLYSCVAGVLSRHLPGPGSRQITQTMMFRNPTFAGEEISIEIEVVEVDPNTGAVRLTTRTLKANGEPGLQGETWVCLPGKPWPETQNVIPNEETLTLEPSAPFRGFEIGQHGELRRVFTQEDLIEYADLADDPNPWILDGSYARQNGLHGQLIPGGLLGGLFSTLLGTRLPGRGTNYLKQSLQFLAPAHPGEELTARVEIAHLRGEKQLVNLITTCKNPSGAIICRGDALVLISDVQ
jgi:acyl dehydratase